MAAGRRRECAIVGPALLLLLAPAPVLADAHQLRVDVRGEGCPDAALLAEKLAPLLSGEVELDVGSASGAEFARAQVEDLGTQYSVAIDGRTRDLADPARDCVERARVAAVFIALNARAARAPAEQPEADAAEAEPARWRFGVRLLGEGGYATAIDRGAFGASAGAWLGRGSWSFAAVAGALATTAVELEPRDGIAGSVELTRFPLSASASYLLRAGPFAAGPVLGLALDLLHLRGADVPRPQTELRANPGALAGADLHVQLGPALALFARAALGAFPRAYDLSVSPAGRLARAPQLWLAASLGLDARLH